MNDLLASVKGGQQENALYNGQGAGRADNTRDLEANHAPPQSGADKDMAFFFNAVNAIKVDMAEIHGLQRQISEANNVGKTIIKTAEVHRHREAMQAQINQVNTLAHRVKAKLEALDQDNEAAKHKEGQGEGSASERTRTTITAGLRKKLKDLMGDFSNLRDHIQEEYHEVVRRRLYTVTGQHVPEEDIDRLIETGESENIFQKAILEQGRGRVLDTLAEIQERHRAVQDLEQGLLELHQIFLDMAVLVDAQGEMLNNIEKQVGRSVDYVKGGTDALVTAKEHQKSTRKWMCCALIILLCIAIAIVIPVVLHFT